VLVDLVRPAVTVAHLAESRLGAEGEGEESHVGFGQADAGILPGRFFSRFDSDDRGRIRIDLAEERELDLSREEPILLPRKGSASCSRDVLLRDVADEVAGDADVEEELARASLLITARRVAGAAPGRSPIVEPRQARERRRPGRRSESLARTPAAVVGPRDAANRSVTDWSCLWSCSICFRSSAASCAAQPRASARCTAI